MPGLDDSASRLRSLSTPIEREGHQPEPSKSVPGDTPPLYNALALQFWILVACQTELGLRDKPGKTADYYHTCYCLSGLSASQSYAKLALGSASNVLAETDPRLNVTLDKLRFAADFFQQH